MLTNRKMKQTAPATKRESAVASVYLRQIHAGQSQITFAGCPTNLDWEDAGP